MPRGQWNGPDSPIVTLPVGPTTTDVLILGRDGILFGWSFIEVTGTANAEIDLYDGTTAGGALIAAVALQPGQSTRDNSPGLGIALTVGLYVHIVAGSVRGALWVVAP